MRLNLAGAKMVTMLLGHVGLAAAAPEDGDGPGESPRKRARKMARPEKVHLAAETPDFQDAEPPVGPPESSFATTESETPNEDGDGDEELAEDAGQPMGILRTLLEGYQKIVGRETISKAELLENAGEVSVYLEGFTKKPGGSALLGNILRANRAVMRVGGDLPKSEVEGMLRVSMGALGIWIICKRHQEDIYRGSKLLSRNYTGVEIGRLATCQSLASKELYNRFSKLKKYRGFPAGHEGFKGLINLPKLQEDCGSVMLLQRMRIGILHASRSFRDGREKAGPELNRVRRLRKFLRELRGLGLSENWVVSPDIVGDTIEEVENFMGGRDKEDSGGSSEDRRDARHSCGGVELSLGRYSAGRSRGHARGGEHSAGSHGTG